MLLIFGLLPDKEINDLRKYKYFVDYFMVHFILLLMQINALPTLIR